MSEYNLKTGDLLLFDYKAGGVFGWFTKMIKFFTDSNYSHCAMVIKDPTYINETLTGYFVWESSKEPFPDPEDGKYKLGVQLTPFNEIYNEYKEKNSNIYVRRISNNSKNYLTEENLKEVHKVVYNKPYDIVPLDWIEAAVGKDSDPQKTDRFWCAALVGYIYTKCKLLDSSTDWSKLSPSSFSSKHFNVKFINDIFFITNEEKIL
tara:strand:+ start:152 stop:769 length:618 start_codon:yes stop_codon:yes gene_type:complete